MPLLEGIARGVTAAIIVIDPPTVGLHTVNLTKRPLGKSPA
jgi:hypothetical protein